MNVTVDMHLNSRCRCFGKPSRRLITEAVLIGELKDNEVMNSRREWSYACLNKVQKKHLASLCQVSSQEGWVYFLGWDLGSFYVCIIPLQPMLGQCQAIFIYFCILSACLVSLSIPMFQPCMLFWVQPRCRQDVQILFWAFTLGFWTPISPVPPISLLVVSMVFLMCLFDDLIIFIETNHEEEMNYIGS